MALAKKRYVSVRNTQLNGTDLIKSRAGKLKCFFGGNVSIRWFSARACPSAMNRPFRV
jgi:hypothetical protein